MRIILTGGHTSPLICVMQALPKDANVLVIGRNHPFEADAASSLEYQLVKDLGVDFSSIDTARVQRKWTSHTLSSLFKLPLGFAESFQILKKFKPDVVASFGGYVSVPVAFAAYVLGIPVVIHEQTLEAGLANKVIALIAQNICISWESSLRFFPKSKTILTGNFLRKEIIKIKQESRIKNKELGSKIPLIYVTGGSTGSHIINTAIEGCIKKLLESYRVVHQTGDSRQYEDYERLIKLKNTFSEKLQKRYILQKFVDSKEAAECMQKADIVVSRSGINTITELLYLQKLSLLIPLPFSQKNEQLKNALFLKKTGFAEILEQKDATSEKLYHMICDMHSRKEEYKTSSEKTRSFIKEDSVKTFISILDSVVKQTSAHELPKI